MKIIIIDSGLGGLSVCASLAHQLELSPHRHPLEIKYVNAVPEKDLGYNQMETRAQKIQIFNRALDGIQHWYQPDLIFVACNTLSVLIEETPFAQNESLKIAGMIPIGTALMLRNLSSQPTSGVLIFATETTIAERVYATALTTAGVAANRIISQAFPGVATLISNDHQGSAVAQEILKYVKMALTPMPRFAPLYAFLGCTHYGYRQALFENAFLKLGHAPAMLLNPNTEAAHHILQQLPSEPAHANRPPNLSIEFITRYALPSNEVNTLSRFLSHAPLTVAALQTYTLKPDLF